jgi:hypothetical protein
LVPFGAALSFCLRTATLALALETFLIILALFLITAFFGALTTLDYCKSFLTLDEV